MTTKEQAKAMVLAGMASTLAFEYSAKGALDAL
jgi:hypothetical protein